MSAHHAASLSDAAGWLHALAEALDVIRRGELEEGHAALVALERPDLTVDQQRSIYGHRAWLRRALGRFEESLSDYDKLIAVKGDDHTARAWRADVKLSLGYKLEAARDCAQVLASDPLNDVAIDVLSRIKQAGNTSVTSPDERIPANRTPMWPINPVVAALERDQHSYPASCCPEMGRLLYDLVRLTAPELCIETGSYAGYSTLCIAQALEDNGRGHLHAFDLLGKNPGYESPVLGPCEQMFDVVRGHLAQASLPHRVTLHAGDSSSGIRTFFGDANGPTAGQVDFALIDGDHRLKGAAKDWAAVDGLLALGALVVLHDTEPKGSGWLGPRALMEALNQHSIDRYVAINLPTRDHYGIGLLQKLSADPARPWGSSWSDQMWERLYSRTVWRGLRP